MALRTSIADSRDLAAAPNTTDDLNEWLAFVHLGIACLVSAPMLYAGVSKLLEPSRFVTTLPKFGIVLLPASVTTARVVGVLELLTGGALVLLAGAPSALLGGLLYCCLALLMSRAVIRGASGDCGCFGALGGRIDILAVARNVALAAAAFGLAYLRSNTLINDYKFTYAFVAITAIALGGALVETLLVFRRASK